MDNAPVAMIAPNRETTCTADGTPYRAGGATLIHVRPEHVAELKRRGFRAVPSTWAVAPAPAPEDAPDPTPPPTAPRRTTKPRRTRA